MTVENNVEDVERVIDRIGRLQSSPTIARKLLGLTRDPDFEMDDVVGCLEHDPALAARILRVVNSSRYGLSHRVSGIRHAAVYLGRGSLRIFIVSFALVDTLAKGARGSLLSDYWQRALTMATVSSELGSKLPGVSKDDVYTGGLLADVGVLAIAQVEWPAYRAIYEGSSHGSELPQAEQDEFGFSHPFLGARLLERWDLPETVVRSTEYHHSTPDNPQPLDLSVRAADLVAEALINTTPPSVSAALEFVEKEFSLDSDQFVELAAACAKDAADSVEVFGGGLAPATDVQKLIDEVHRVKSGAALDMAEAES